VRLLIVDDEQPARDRLRRILEEEDEYEVVGEAGTGLDAIAMSARLEPDAVLLDIRMPGLTGIETAHHLNSLERPPAVVFTTAYDEYAVEAFEARAIGYVLKPVRRKRVIAALQQAAKLTVNTLRDAATDANLSAPRQHVCARSHGELELIPIADIRCFCADQKYVRVEHENGAVLIDEPLKSLADEFVDRFVRIHRGALVAVDRIERVEKTPEGKSRVVLRGRSHVDDNEMIISRRHVADVRRRLKES
jgi:two-component system response regulator AlgR